jgi:hypothetical protein
VARRVALGYRLRLGLSTSDFPMIWPAPDPVTVTVHTDGGHLDLPLRGPSPEDDALAPFEPAVTGAPLEIEKLSPGENWVRITEDAATGAHVFAVADGDGAYRIPGSDFTVTEQGYERHSIRADDPLSARATADWTLGLSRGEWLMRSETQTEPTSDAESFRIRARMRVWLGEEMVADREWDERMARTLVCHGWRRAAAGKPEWPKAQRETRR